MKEYYVLKNGRLRRHENTIEFVNGDQKRSLPLHNIYSLHLFGETDLNTKVLNFLSQNGIPIHFYNFYGYYSGSFYPREKLVSGFVLVKQVGYYTDHDKRLELAREFVNTALRNILSNLEHYRKNGKNVSDSILMIEKEVFRLSDAAGIPELMAIEGRVREIYYSSFGKILRPGFDFERRSRRPPENMLNCMISFGNSLLYSSVLGEIYHTQLNPTISYLHEPGQRRFSLALDISEVFKPLIVDRIIFSLINNRIIKTDHFLKEVNSCYLNEAGKRVFLEAYRKKLDKTVVNSRLKRQVSYQRLIRLECFKLLKHILGEKSYRGLKSR